MADYDIMDENVPKKYLTQEEASAYIRCALGTFQNHLKDWGIPVIRYCRKLPIYDVADLDKFMAEHKVFPTGERVTARERLPQVAAGELRVIAGGVLDKGNRDGS